MSLGIPGPAIIRALNIVHQGEHLTALHTANLVRTSTFFELEVINLQTLWVSSQPLDDP